MTTSTSPVSFPAPIPATITPADRALIQDTIWEIGDHAEYTFDQVYKIAQTAAAGDLQYYAGARILDGQDTPALRDAYEGKCADEIRDAVNEAVLEFGSKLFGIISTYLNNAQ